MAPNYTINAPAERINSTTAPRDPDVHCAIKAIEEEIALLGSVSDDLLGRIGPVMREPTPFPSTTEHKASGSCAISAMLNERCDSLKRIRERLADAYQRVEL